LTGNSPLSNRFSCARWRRLTVSGMGLFLNGHPGKLSAQSRPHVRRHKCADVAAQTGDFLLRQWVRQHHFALTTRISDLVPEFSAGVRNEITIFHLLTHTSGLPIVFEVKPGMFIDRFDEMVAAVCANIAPAEPPGERVAY